MLCTNILYCGPYIVCFMKFINFMNQNFTHLMTVIMDLQYQMYNDSRYLSAINKSQHQYGMKNCEDHFGKLCPVCFLCIFAHTGHHCRIMAQQLM